MRLERFTDEWRGNGVQLVLSMTWTLALRWRWRLRFVRPPGKPGYSRLYIGPLEVEHRKPPKPVWAAPKATSKEGGA